MGGVWVCSSLFCGDHVISRRCSASLSLARDTTISSDFALWSPRSPLLLRRIVARLHAAESTNNQVELCGNSAEAEMDKLGGGWWNNEWNERRRRRADFGPRESERRAIKYKGEKRRQRTRVGWESCFLVSVSVAWGRSFLQTDRH